MPTKKAETGSEARIAADRLRAEGRTELGAQTVAKLLEATRAELELERIHHQGTRTELNETKQLLLASLKSKPSLGLFVHGEALVKGLLSEQEYSLGGYASSVCSVYEIAQRWHEAVQVHLYPDETDQWKEDEAILAGVKQAVAIIRSPGPSSSNRGSS